jgi:hypothetical protein
MAAQKSRLRLNRCCWRWKEKAKSQRPPNQAINQPDNNSAVWKKSSGDDGAKNWKSEAELLLFLAAEG